ncbi:MAG: hypothetical protein GY822_11290 [Deltaproteobacteria bacterium]|nr:hypothetical protein [Deltaproteobacteria bacterium]
MERPAATDTTEMASLEQKEIAPLVCGCVESVVVVKGQKEGTQKAREAQDGQVLKKTLPQKSVSLATLGSSLENTR